MANVKLTEHAGVEKSMAKPKANGRAKQKAPTATAKGATKIASNTRTPLAKPSATAKIMTKKQISASKKAPATKIAPASKSAAKKTPAKAQDTETTLKVKALTKAAAKPSANSSKKRKNDGKDSVGHEETPPQAKKPRFTKKATTKKVINQVPTQRLDVYVFGEGSSSELGLGTAKSAIDVKRPRLNPLLSAQDVRVVQIACGGMHVAALTHDNKILTWGVNDQAALGRDTTWEGGLKDMDDNNSDDSDRSDSGLNPAESNPTVVPASSFPEDTVFVKLSAGDSHTLALTDNGFVYGWGTFRKFDGVLGFLSGSDIEIQTTPVLLPELKNIVDISSGANHAMAIDNKGAVFIWGSGEQNQLGYHIIERTGTSNDKLTLKPQHLRTKIRTYKAIYTGLDHSFAIDLKDRVWSWGVNSFGGTGILEGAGDDNAVVYNPTIVETLKFEDDSIIHMDGGQHHSVAITEKGKALIWGRVDGFQTGLDMSTIPRDSTIRDNNDNPRIVIVPTEIPNVGTCIHASAGTDHTILLNYQGQAYAWGLSATYQTGLATTNDIEFPTHIDNTAVRGKTLNWSGCGGQYSVLTAPAKMDTVLDGADNTVGAPLGS